MKYLIFISLISLLLLSCENEQPSGYLELKLNNGFYVIVEKGENQLQAAEGFYILYSLLAVDENGTVFFDRRKEDMLMREQVRSDSFTLKNLSPVSELIRMLSKGDSAILKLPLSKEEKIDELSNSDTLIFHIRISKIMNEMQVIDNLRKKFELDKEQNARESNRYLEAREHLMSHIEKIEKGKYEFNQKLSPGGLKYYIIKDGEGETPKRGQRVRFDYIALLEKNKKEIDNSFNREQSAELIAGARQEIPGLDEAIFLMNKNMTAIFFIPSEKAYGKSGKPGVVASGSDLIYFITLSEIIN